MADSGFTTFTNCRYCLNGELVRDHLVTSADSGTILPREGFIGGDIVDLEDAIIAPGFIELHTNGGHGFHFTHFENAELYEQKLADISKYYISQGLTSFYATLPTITSENFQKILPSLTPHSFTNSATLLGAHCEGPFLWPSKKGAHNSSLFATPPTSAADVYGDSNLSTSVKLVTLAPDIEGTEATIQELVNRGIKVSLGHSNASYTQGLSGLRAGANMLTHTLNAMSPLQSREPGLAGLITLPQDEGVKAPFYSIIPDGHHLHPNTVSFLHRAAPQRSILITDSIELAGLPDGLYPGHSQISHQQRKRGNLVTIEGTDTLIGGCISLSECVRNLMKWSGCDVAEAARTVTENVAAMMGIDGEGGRGILLPGRRADLCVLNDEGEVLQTYVAGKKVWEAT